MNITNISQFALNIPSDPTAPIPIDLTLVLQDLALQLDNLIIRAVFIIFMAQSLYFYILPSLREKIDNYTARWLIDHMVGLLGVFTTGFTFLLIYFAWIQGLLNAFMKVCIIGLLIIEGCLLLYDLFVFIKKRQYMAVLEYLRGIFENDEHVKR